MQYCPKCHAEVAPDDNFCRKCGAPLGTKPSPQLSETVAQMAAEYSRQVRDNPDDAAARHSLGLAYMYGGDFAAAKEQFEIVVTLEPQFADGHAKLAMCLAQLGNVEAARRAISRALELEPDNARVREMAGRLKAL